MRPNPDELLVRVKTEEERGQRGKLKIFFGSAPGVGKTYAMLEAARKVAKEGRDVVVGYVEPHARPETQALVLGLDVLARKPIEYRGRTLLEFDLQAALLRRPQLILVDELAHTNAHGDGDSLTYAKRYQDIEALLAAGIDVYTTVNVQHIESLNDIVAKITGVVVRETVPDQVFELADEVELVDIAPDDLLDRLKEGRIYVPNQAARALERFFSKGNLIALRELALRKMADRVERQMTAYRAEQAIGPTWPAAERLLVCVTPGPTSANLVRAARRMAASLRAPWLAAHVETPAEARLAPAAREQLAENLHLARRLGAEIVTLGGNDVTGEIVAYARRRNVTKIIVGKSLAPRWKELIFGSFVYDLTRRCDDIDVYVISGEDAHPIKPAPVVQPPLAKTGYVAAIMIVLACTLISFPLASLVSHVTLAMVYLAGVVATASRFGRGPSILCSLLSVLVFDFCFVSPTWTFAVHDTQYLFMFVVMFGIGLLISTLTGRLKFQAELARERAERTESLYGLARALVQMDDLEQVSDLAPQFESLLSADAFVLLPSGGDSSQTTLKELSATGQSLSEQERAVGEWAFKNRQNAGHGTDVLNSAPTLFVPLATSGNVVGVLGVRPKTPTSRVTPDALRVIDAVADQLALAVERIQSRDLARQSQLGFDRERLRNALLSAVSHDLRTPLAAIAGAGSTLAEAGDSLPPQVRRELADSIVSETQRLNRLISNLLDMTRLEAGSLQLRREWLLLGDLCEATLTRLAAVLASHRVNMSLPEGLSLVYVDEMLFDVVLANLLENAARYSPPGSNIQISAGFERQQFWLEVADEGIGIPAGDEEQVFEKFYRSPNAAERAGSGLGLAICRGIVELHGGTITATNQPGGGARLRVELPQPPQPSLPVEATGAATSS